VHMQRRTRAGALGLGLTSVVFRFRLEARFRHLGLTPRRGASSVGLYTMLTLPILYGVWHKKAVVVGGSYIAHESCNSIE